MASRKRMMWTRVAIVATLMISAPALSSAQGAGARQQAPRLPHKVEVAAAVAWRCTPLQPAQKT